MNDRDVRRYERATRVQTFGIQNAADFAAGAKAKTHFDKLDDLLAAVDQAKAGQTPSRVSKATLLDALLLDLKNISRTARSIELTQSGFAAPYRIPDNPAEVALTSHADALLARLEDDAGDSATVTALKTALRAKFIACEMSPDFVADLRADRKAITEANQFNQSEVQDGAGNTELIGELLTQINTEIVQLDAIMYNKYTRQPDKLRAWQSASHLERAPQRAKKPTPPPTPPAPTPT